MISDTLDPFIVAYRDSLEQQRDLNRQQLDAQRRNDFTSIMSGANKAGMMYSNLGAREKMKYDQQTYQPNLIKIQNSYRTGIDKLRENTIKMANQLGTINKAIEELNAG